MTRGHNTDTLATRGLNTDTLGHVSTVQGVLRAGERGDERGAGGDGAAVPGGLVLERGLGRLPGQHRQSVTRSHYGH